VNKKTKKSAQDYEEHKKGNKSQQALKIGRYSINGQF